MLGAWLILLSSVAGLRSKIWLAALHGLGVLVGVLLIAALILPAPLDSIGPLLAIVYAGWLAWQFWRAERS